MPIFLKVDDGADVIDVAEIQGWQTTHGGPEERVYAQLRNGERRFVISLEPQVGTVNLLDVLHGQSYPGSIQKEIAAYAGSDGVVDPRKVARAIWGQAVSS